MHATKVLHKLIKAAVPSIHAKRLEVLLRSIEAVLRGADVSITSMGRWLPGTAFIKHKIKCMDRLIGNTHLLQVHPAMYSGISKWVLKSIPMPLILIDWSDLNTDRSLQLLRASIAVGGRAITLYEQIHPFKKLGNRKVQHCFLRQLANILPDACQPIIVADSGFRVPFFREVEKIGWYWIGRIRNRDMIAFERSADHWIAAKSLYELAKSKPRMLGNVFWVRNHPLQGRLLIVRNKAKGRKDKTTMGGVAKNARSRKLAKREIEPWLLVFSLSLPDYSAKTLVSYYQTRMQIEEGFRDTKNSGFGLGIAKQARIQPDRLRNMLLICALASLALWLIGKAVVSHPIARHVQVNTSTQRDVYSAIFLARLIIGHTDFRIRDSDVVKAREAILEYYISLDLAP